MQIEQLDVDQLDFPGWRIDRCGTTYDISYSQPNATGGEDHSIFSLPFQHGPATETNGLLNELVIMVVVDRLKQFQLGAFPSQWNQKAICALELALGYLAARDLERKAAVKCDTSASSLG